MQLGIGLGTGAAIFTIFGHKNKQDSLRAGVSGSFRSFLRPFFFSIPLFNLSTYTLVGWFDTSFIYVIIYNEMFVQTRVN